MLDVVPEVLPHLLLRRATLTDEVAPDLDVGAVNNGQVRAHAPDERDESRHLGVICTTVLRVRYAYTRKVEDEPMKAMSTPPFASGPPSAVQRKPFFKIH